MYEIIFLLLIILVTIKYSIQISNKYLQKLNNENTFFIYVKIFITLAIFLGIFLFILLLLNILNIDIKINITNISSIGIITAVLLTISHNFYLKNEEEVNNKQKSKLIISYTIEKMFRNCQNELIRIREQEVYLNKLLTEKDSDFNNFYLDSIKKYLEDNLKILLDNIKYLDNITILTEIELELLKIQPSKFKEQRRLIEQYHNNNTALTSIKNKLNQLLEVNKE
ncbi:hypothetical protein [Arcobacter sp. L]|uniref:hypothetical protein n=1 Tax=Arcobacter sp. L TaxID=944547 RepID=UPI000229608A|nr:hypothetical protein [Arcobacter sp. L]BAK72898.1 hypothetical protein ABLL_1023 [Arcobacter sp. L]